MAKVIDNPKGFKVIQIRGVELMKFTPMAMGICDYCGQASLDGFYIAVLNSYYCPKCYEEWCKRAEYFDEDRPFEESNFNRMLAQLKQHDLLEVENENIANQRV